MKKIVLLIIAFFVGLGTNIFAQTINNNNNQPKVDIKVKIKRDSNGNIISYDSTYTKTFVSSNLKESDIDSLMAYFNNELKSFGFSENCFTDFSDIQKQMMCFPNIPDFFTNDSTLFEFPSIFDFGNFDDFFNNQIDTKKSYQNKSQSKAVKKPKLNPINTYQF